MTHVPVYTVCLTLYYARALKDTLAECQYIHVYCTVARLLFADGLHHAFGQFAVLSFVHVPYIDGDELMSASISG
jgi:hypothetical protein